MTTLKKKNSFARNAMIMSSGAIINVFIALLLTPVVTRLYSKEEWGVFTLFVSTVSTLSILSAMLLPAGFVIPKFRKEFLALLKISLISLLSFSGLTFVGVLIFKDLILKSFKIAQLGNMIYLVPLGVLFVTGTDILVNWNVRTKYFSANAKSNVAGSLVTKATQIGSKTLVDFGYFGLVASHFFAYFFRGFLLINKSTFKNLNYLKIISFDYMWEVLKDYKKYPLLLMPGNFVNTLGRSLPVFFFTASFGLGVTGSFGLALSILSIPYKILGNSIAPVFLQRANELYFEDPKKLRDFASLFHKKMHLSGSLIFGVVFGFGDLLFPFILGENWDMAGQFAQALSLYFAVMLIMSPLARIFRVVRKEQFAFFIHAVIFFLRLVALSIGIETKDPLIAVYLYAMANLIGYLIGIFFVYKILGLNPLKIILSSLATGVAIYGSFFGLRLLIF